tara:strand:- start:522 stop:758 length:237 start_codon:yes stop_codon:yes gene_type:complete
MKNELQKTANRPSPNAGDAFSTQKVVEKLKIKNDTKLNINTYMLLLLLILTSLWIKKRGTNAMKINGVKATKLVGQLK